MDTRPCLSSYSRSLSNFSWLPSAIKPRGSKSPSCNRNGTKERQIGHPSKRKIPFRLCVTYRSLSSKGIFEGLRLQSAGGDMLLCRHKGSGGADEGKKGGSLLHHGQFCFLTRCIRIRGERPWPIEKFSSVDKICFNFLVLSVKHKDV